MKIFLASDHGGFKLKEEIKNWFNKTGVDFIDGGTDSEDITHPQIYARKGVDAILSGKADLAILVCGTGFGMAMQANRFKGIRAVATDNVPFTVLAREHNDANVLCLAGRFTKLLTAKKIIKAFLDTKFLSDTERYVVRKKLLDE